MTRGDVWLVNLDPTKGREQSGQRPALVISVDTFNQGPAELVIVCPITSVPKGIPLHVRITPPEGGLQKVSYVKCEDVRSISTERLGKRLGRVNLTTMNAVEEKLKILLDL